MLSSTWAQQGPLPERGALDRLQAALERGDIGESEAARQTLLYLFDRSGMDPRWRVEGEPPAKCGTVLLARIQGRLGRVDAGTRQLFERLAGGAQNDAAPNLYNTLHFRIEYQTTGPDAPPASDVTPANGVPDFVERTGEACERSWSIEVDSLGYRAPPLSGGGRRYTVRYQNQSSYGYTIVSGPTTEIVLHPNYVGFPFNDDPDGDVIGSLRVTVAHELKHAIQRMYSSWIEDNWLELDATWIEDLVYDEVNDYLHFVRRPGSPFTAPALPLNAGGSGSYEDCNWQHFQSQTYGNAFLLRFWERRAMNSEPVISTYTATFAEEGVTFEDAWGEYVAWNFASGARAGAGFGYEEAARYPTPPAGTFHATLPVQPTVWYVDHLAVGAHLIDNPDGALAGTPEFTFSGSSHIAWRVSVLVQDRMGVVTRVPVALTGGAATLPLSGFDWADLRWAALLAGNPYEGGPPFGYTFSARAVAPIHILHAHLPNQAYQPSYPIVARVVPGIAPVAPASVSLSYRVDHGAIATIAMTATGNPDEYTAEIPGQAFGATIEYAIDAQSEAGQAARSPAIPNAWYPFQVVSVFEPFESPGLWTVGDTGDDAVSGTWERTQPNGNAAAPYADATLPPGAVCFVTENEEFGDPDGDSDVDGGKTTLLSPVFTLGTVPDQLVARYRRWYSNDIGGRPDDIWRVDASNDGGATWANVETASLGENAWVPVTVDLLALFGAPDRLRFRFVAEDAGNPSWVEAGVDDFELLAIQYGPVGVSMGENTALRLEAPVPNPSRGTITLRLALPRASELRAVVRDLQGRRVRSLAPLGRVLAAGFHTLTWDGRDDRRALAPAGLYFVEVEACERRLLSRVVRLR
jgi:hypothetical protein